MASETNVDTAEVGNRIRNIAILSANIIMFVS